MQHAFGSTLIQKYRAFSAQPSDFIKLFASFLRHYRRQIDRHGPQREWAAGDELPAERTGENKSSGGSSAASTREISLLVLVSICLVQAGFTFQKILVHSRQSNAQPSFRERAGFAAFPTPY